MTDVHDEDVSGHWHRDAGLLQVEQAEGRRHAELSQQVPDEERTVTDEFWQVPFEDGKGQQGDDGGGEHADGPPATLGSDRGNRASRHGSGTPPHVAQLCRSFLNSL
jgi:hypothetical protein